MGFETAIALCLSTLFFGLAWVSFKLNESDSDILKYVGVLFLAKSLMILNIIAWLAMSIAEANSFVAFSGVATVLMTVITLTMTIFWFVLFLRAFIALAKWLVEGIRKHSGKEDFFD
jgi:hypothetical protein